MLTFIWRNEFVFLKGNENDIKLRDIFHFIYRKLDINMESRGTTPKLFQHFLSHFHTNKLWTYFNHKIEIFRLNYYLLVELWETNVTNGRFFLCRRASLIPSSISGALMIKMAPPMPYIMSGSFVTNITCFPSPVSPFILVTVSNQIMG